MTEQIANYVEYPGTLERDAAERTEDSCYAEAGGWLCTRKAGHEMPHQAGAGFDGSDVFAEWETSPATTHRPETTTDAREANPHG